MKPPTFDYYRPSTLQECVTLLRESRGQAKLLAGGQSLIPMLNLRLVRPRALVDLARVPGLSFIREDTGAIVVGAFTRHADVEASKLVGARLPLLSEAVRHIGHISIRNRGTIGGSIAHADPAAELTCVLLALDGSVAVVGPDGERAIPATELFKGYFQTSVASDEVVSAVRFPIPAGGSGWAFEEVSRRRGDFALAMVVVAIHLDTRGRIDRVSLALGGVAPAPVRGRHAESLLLGATPEPVVLDRAARLLADDCDPDGDVHASPEDRVHLVTVLGRRGIERAIDRAKVQSRDQGES